LVMEVEFGGNEFCINVGVFGLILRFLKNLWNTMNDTAINRLKLLRPNLENPNQTENQAPTRAAIPTEHGGPIWIFRNPRREKST
jgi:hypothetical protein